MFRLKKKAGATPIDRTYAAIAFLALTATVILYFWRRSFYLSLVPLVLGTAAGLGLALVEKGKASRRLSRCAEALLGFYESFAQRLELGDTAGSAAHEEAGRIAEREVRDLVEEYLSAPEAGSVSFVTAYSTSEAEKDLAALLQYGLVHQASAEYRASLATAVAAFREDLGGRTVSQEKSLFILDCVFVGAALLSSLILLAAFFRTFL